MLLFPNGTTIFGIAPDGTGTYTITMSAAAKASGSPGKSGVGGSFAFVGSQYTSATTGNIAPSTNQITGLDAVNAGMYLRPE